MDLQFTEKNRLLSIYVLLLLLVGVGMFYLGRCSSGRGSDDDDPVADTLHVAIEYAPMSMYTYADTLGGFNYDLLRIISQNYGVTMMFHPIVSRQEGINGLMNKTYDLLVADIPATLGSEEGLKYTEPVYLDRQVLVQRRDSAGNIAVKSVLELGDRTVWVVKDSPMVTRLQNLSEEIGDTIYVNEYDGTSSEQLFILTAIGDIGMCVINDMTARRLAKSYPNVDTSTKVSLTQFQSWLIREDHPLADSLNSIIRSLKQEPVYRELQQRYLQAN